MKLTEVTVARNICADDHLCLLEWDVKLKIRKNSCVVSEYIFFQTKLFRPGTTSHLPIRFVEYRQEGEVHWASVSNENLVSFSHIEFCINHVGDNKAKHYMNAIRCRLQKSYFIENPMKSYLIVHDSIAHGLC